MPEPSTNVNADPALLQKCRERLPILWSEIRSSVESGSQAEFLDDDALILRIRESLSEKNNKSYRYVLPTQLLAKVSDPSLDCRCLQEKADSPGSFDPRSICSKVVSPFERSHWEGVLGRSADPYVNNPLRVEYLDRRDKKSKQKPEMWELLCDIVERVETENSASFTEACLKQVLKEIYALLQTARILYDVPLRVSLPNVMAAIRLFGAEKSGGDRTLALTTALFQVIGQNLAEADGRIRRGKINESDAASGQAGDIEWTGPSGAPRCLVEVKDKPVTLSDLEEKLVLARAKGFEEVFFISGRGQGTDSTLSAHIARDFASGQNVYVFDLAQFAEPLLAVLGEKVRRDFLHLVGAQLDEFSDAKHRLAWKTTLEHLRTSDML